MQIDFSKIDNTIFNEMALTLTIFVLGTAVVAWIIGIVLSKLKMPMFIVNPIITIAVIGCLYYWAKYFLS